jgi:hypothetical protein
MKVAPSMTDGENVDIYASREYLEIVFGLLHRSQKFLLPTGGRMFDDKMYSGLIGVDEINLPYKEIAIEYHVGKIGVDVPPPEEDEVFASKRIILAKEIEDMIAIIPVVFMHTLGGIWMTYPPLNIEKKDTIDRSRVSVEGRPYVHVSVSEYIHKNHLQKNYMDELDVLFGLLSILNCKNVRIEKSLPHKPTNIKKRRKKAFGFDSYHILTVGSNRGKGGKKSDGLSERRSPREHLRRGHIRRLKTHNVWVNAAIINRGIGGKVSKSYGVST